MYEMWHCCIGFTQIFFIIKLKTTNVENVFSMYLDNVLNLRVNNIGLDVINVFFENVNLFL